ncbi:hypothetical protein F2Q70_00035808 [Brassica cretica]|uniref:Secreted protein n=1 Tax=Brassica cretica TaxID=69181 RepID=A0A8S9JZM0_BRACR|nr:hypothetical protein F2Q70_00035808 [Brassica cretica]
MSGVHASRHTGLCMPVRMRRSQVLRHLVLLCVELHGTASCTSTPPSCVETQQVKWLTPRPDPSDQATSSFSVDLRDFGSSGRVRSSAACLSLGRFQTRAPVRSRIEVRSGTEVRFGGEDRSWIDDRSWFEVPIGGIRCVWVVLVVLSVPVGPMGKVSVLKLDPVGSTLSTPDGVAPIV